MKGGFSICISKVEIVVVRQVWFAGHGKVGGDSLLLERMLSC